MAEHNLFGVRGEAIAARYLLEKGFIIRECNWRSGHKEIDIVAQEDDVLVFVEVKTRRNDTYGDASDAVTPMKMRRLIFAAEAYIKMKELDMDVRFDIITVVGCGDECSVEHIREAFYPGIS